jgi:plasmid maintenance system antidote protein VapI
MMSHPFGDLISQHLHRKHGLSQAKLAEGILQPPIVISLMCKGQRLTGPQARQRVLERYTLSGNINQLERLYNQVLEQRQVRVKC